MSYLVLARKWRPNLFSDLVGQNHVVKALSYALESDNIHHAYLFTGTRGVGKTSIARIFAKSLNCETNGVSANPCGSCSNCVDIEKGKFVDLIEVDAASRTGVDETRDLIESVSYLPTKAKYKVYIIDEVHMFSKSSFNALLKTLEEPPKHVKFILATTDPEKLPSTILSRCLQFNLKSIREVEIANYLEKICKVENIEFEQKALKLLAKAGNGSMRDALSITDQAIAFGQGKLEFETVSEVLGSINPTDIDCILVSILENNPSKLHSEINKFDDYDIDVRSFLNALLTKIKDIAWCKEGVLVEISKQIETKLNKIPRELIQLWYEIIQKGLAGLDSNLEQKQSLEMILLRMVAFIPTNIVKKQDTNGMLELESERPQSIKQPKNVEEKENVEEKKSFTKEKAIEEDIKEQVAMEEISVELISENETHEEELNLNNSNSEKVVNKVKVPEEKTESVLTEKEALELVETDVQENELKPSVKFSLINDTITNEETQTKEKGSSKSINNLTDKSITELETVEKTNDDSYQNIPPPWEEIESSTLPSKGLMDYSNQADEKETVRKKESELEESQKIISSDLEENKVELITQKVIEDFNWIEVFNSLELSSFTRGFASLGVVTVSNNKATFTMNAQNEVLKTPKAVDELEKALQTKLGISKLEIVLGEVSNTPSSLEEEQEVEEENKLISNFDDDKIVKKLKDVFGATIVPNSVINK